MHALFSFRWSQGYTGTKFHYIKKDVLCYVCGNSIKFINTSTKDESFISSEGAGVACFAVNPTNMAVGFADKSMEPNIYVFKYPNLITHRAKLKGQNEGAFQLTIQTKLELCQTTYHVN